MAIRKETPKKFKTLAPSTINKWKKGTVVEGTLLEIRESPSDRFEGKGHILDLEVNGDKQAWGCPTVLYNYLRQVDVGDYVKITCEGKIVVPRGKAWDFTVEVAADEDDDDTNDKDS
jgi:hypothetical protein